ncbi:hypothetical protein [Draconibacterium mangrovi]|uniref:hypothetical protein n=1 Tax=Draconibacterium mangrovi TaxID=2697469 RepID=UPI0013D176E9|nr:hypothetical protein [Draconibacterium mangrovi]
MDRKDFLKKSCSLGICSCIVPGILPVDTFAGNENSESSWKEGFVKHRFSKLIDLMDENLTEETRNKILENLGRECSNRSGIDKFKNDLQGFFQHLKTTLNETATYDKERGVIRVETAERPCFCPMFDSQNISESICQCSVGWQSQSYETILGQAVEAKCLESVIRGSSKCVFEIRLFAE